MKCMYVYIHSDPVECSPKCSTYVGDRNMLGMHLLMWELPNLDQATVGSGSNGLIKNGKFK